MTRTITNNRTVYVGNLPGDVREREVEDLFHKYGRIVDIDLKLPPRPPGYAFVEFADTRDAEDAIRGRDGYDFDGSKLRVELAHGGRGSSSHAPPYDRSNHFNSGVGRPTGVSRRSEYREGGARPTGVSRRSEYRVIVTGLPSSASWQDLKDHMRRAGDVCFAQVFRDGSGAMGIVDYTNYDDMKYAIKKLDDTEFRNPFARGYIRIKEDKGTGKQSYSRSRSRSRSRSKSYSRSLSRSKSRSKSRSLSRSRSRSPIKSKGGRKYSRSYSRSLSKEKSKSRSRSMGRSRSRSRSKSPVKSVAMDERKASRSLSPVKDETMSRERSRSRSLSPEKKVEKEERSMSVEKELDLNKSEKSRSVSRERSLSPVKSRRSPSPNNRSRSRSVSPRQSPPNDNRDD